MRQHYDQQTEKIIKNIFKTSTLNTEQQKAAKQIAEITASFSSKLISDPKLCKCKMFIYRPLPKRKCWPTFSFWNASRLENLSIKKQQNDSEIMRNSIAMSAEAMMQDRLFSKMNRQIEKTLTPLFEQAKKVQ